MVGSKRSMSLNAFRNEVAEFLEIIDPQKQKTGKDIFDMLEEEYRELKMSLSQPDRLQHQIYDMFFLLFELAVKHNIDLDAEWNLGRIKKQKYQKLKITNNEI
jgi:hypothetical protein